MRCVGLVLSLLKPSGCMEGAKYWLHYPLFYAETVKSYEVASEVVTIKASFCFIIYIVFDFICENRSKLISCHICPPCCRMESEAQALEGHTVSAYHSLRIYNNPWSLSVDAP